MHIRVLKRFVIYMAILTFVMFTVWGFVRSFMNRPPGDYETEVCDIRLKDKKYEQALEAANEALNLTGVILTKLDGDTRGGAALSIRSVSGVPIKFVGVSEKIDGIEKFDPKRIADRILGFGDVLSLVDKVEKVVKEEDYAKIEQKLKNDSFDFNDFRDQLNQIRKMGSMTELIGMIPGISRKIKGLNLNEKQLVWTEAIINSMTLKERARPEIIDSSRKKRIAEGSGRTVFEVNSLIKKFADMKKMMKKMKQKESKIPMKRIFRKFS